MRRLSSSALNPITVNALGVFTQDLVRAAGPAAESPFNSENEKGHWPNYRSGVY
jgi:hypothetical protein